MEETRVPPEPGGGEPLSIRIVCLEEEEREARERLLELLRRSPRLLVEEAGAPPAARGGFEGLLEVVAWLHRVLRLPGCAAIAYHPSGLLEYILPPAAADAAPALAEAIREAARRVGVDAEVEVCGSRIRIRPR